MKHEDSTTHPGLLEAFFGFDLPSLADELLNLLVLFIIAMSLGDFVRKCVDLEIFCSI